nr:flavone 6-hydroxylase [Tanacetum cinerariifolium]
MEHVLSPLPFTNEAVRSLNNASVNFQDAPALFNVDLSTFKAMLRQINIFFWKEVDGSLVRIHRGDYDITILIKGMRKRYVVKITD